MVRAFLMALRRRRASHEFNKLIQAYDDAIDAARAKHRPTQALIQAKSDFVHGLLRREVGV